jgi:hypothetical protein
MMRRGLCFRAESQRSSVVAVCLPHALCSSAVLRPCDDAVYEYMCSPDCLFNWNNCKSPGRAYSTGMGYALARIPMPWCRAHENPQSGVFVLHEADPDGGIRTLLTAAHSRYLYVTTLGN